MGGSEHGEATQLWAFKLCSVKPLAATNRDRNQTGEGPWQNVLYVCQRVGRRQRTEHQVTAVSVFLVGSPGMEPCCIANGISLHRALCLLDDRSVEPAHITETNP